MCRRYYATANVFATTGHGTRRVVFAAPGHGDIFFFLTTHRTRRLNLDSQLVIFYVFFLNLILYTTTNKGPYWKHRVFFFFSFW